MEPKDWDLKRNYSKHWNSFRSKGSTAQKDLVLKPLNLALSSGQMRQIWALPPVSLLVDLTIKPLFISQRPVQ